MAVSYGVVKFLRAATTVHYGTSLAPSKREKSLDHIRAMEVECEIRDEAGDLVRPTSGATMLNYQPVDSAGNILTGYSRNAVIRANTRQAALARRATATARPTYPR
jgi:hypothetical protein